MINAKAVMNARAYTVTVTAIVLGTLLLNTAIVLHTSYGLQAADLKQSASMEKLQAKHENISQNVLEILQGIGGVNWSVQGNKVVFKETLPNKDKSTQFNADLETYKQFVARNKAGLDINLNVGAGALGIVHIQPFDVNYDHPLQEGKKAKQYNVSQVSPSAVNFDGYTIAVTLQNQSYQSLQTSLHTCNGSCSKAVYLDLNILNSNKLPQAAVFEANLDPQQTSTITIKTSGASNNDIVITLGPNGKLDTENDNSVPINLETTIDFTSQGPVPVIGLAGSSVQAADQLGQRKT